MINLNEENFNDHVKDGISVVDFWADWCGPCKMIAPILENVSSKFKDNDTVNIYKVNVDKEPSIAQKYGVSSIPTLVFIKNGEVIKSAIGVQPEATITNAIEHLLS